MISKVNTGSALVHRFDNVLPSSVCESIQEFMDRAIIRKDVINPVEVPWGEDEMVNYDQIPDNEVKSVIRDIRFKIAELASECFGVKLYPHFTDLVLWRTGRKMQTHQDDGGLVHGFLFPRKVSCVVYLNEDFEGGETIIKTEFDVPYKSIPKQGSVVIFLSDSRCEHSVNEVLAGDRYTLPIWFTDNPEFSEIDH